MVTSTKHQFLVTVSGVKGYWDEMTGGAGTGTPIRHRNGGSLKEEIIGTPPTYSDIVVTRGFSPAYRDAYVNLAKNINKTRHTVTKQPTDPDLVPVGKPITYPSCLLVGVTFPDSDSNAVGDRSTVQLTFSTNGPA